MCSEFSQLAHPSKEKFKKKKSLSDSAYGFLKSTEIGLIQKSEKDISLGHQQQLSFILCFHVPPPTIAVQPLSL